MEELYPAAHFAAKQPPRTWSDESGGALPIKTSHSLGQAKTTQREANKISLQPSETS